MPQEGLLGVQITAPKSIIAWAKSPARFFWHQRLSMGFYFSFYLVYRPLDGVFAGHYPHHVAINHGNRLAKGDCRDSS